MGYNQSDKDLVLRYIDGVKNVLDYGSQNNYTTTLPNPPFISEWYKGMGIDYYCIDLAGDNGAFKANLAYPIHNSDEWTFFLPSDIFENGFDLTVDAGSKEHFCQAESYPVTSFHEGYINSVYPENVTDALAGFYWGWKNQFELTKTDGIIISVNPKTGHWENHCHHWIDRDFYVELCKISDMEYLELYESSVS